jgi:hypothetical protein
MAGDGGGAWGALAFVCAIRCDIVIINLDWTMSLHESALCRIAGEGARGARLALG